MKKLILTKKNFWICLDEKSKEYFAVPANYFDDTNNKLVANGFVATQWVLGTQVPVNYMQIASGDSVVLNVITMKDLGL
jgi:hypothetical protein